PLALEAGADEEERPRALADAERGARDRTVARAVVGMEALEVDTVVDHREVGGRRAVEPRDLVPALPRDRDHVARRASLEDAPLERAHQPVVGIDARLPAHRGEVAAVAALPRPVEVLPERALVTLHEIVAVARRLALRGQGEG